MYYGNRKRRNPRKEALAKELAELSEKYAARNKVLAPMISRIRSHGRLLLSEVETRLAWGYPEIGMVVLAHDRGGFGLNIGAPIALLRQNPETGIVYLQYESFPGWKFIEAPIDLFVASMPKGVDP
jgi:hypothetical protein